jgi:hypothetical protein
MIENLARSAQVREQHPEHLDLPYGPRSAIASTTSPRA